MVQRAKKMKAINRITISKQLFLDILISVGLSLLITSPYFLETVSSNAYFAFDIVEAFLMPQTKSVGVLALLIYLMTMVGRKYPICPRWFVLILLALVFLFAFRGFLTTAGINPQAMTDIVLKRLLFFNQNWLDPITFKRVVVGIAFGFLLIFLPRYIYNTEKLFKAFAAFGWALGFIAIYRSAPVIATDIDYAISHQQTITANGASANPVDKRVVWVIFDELDYARLFENRFPNLILPNIDRLRSQSVHAVNAVSPAWSTAISIPALTTGIPLVGTEPNGPGGLTLRKADGEVVDWKATSNVFTRLSNDGKKSSILGYYHPYCSIFKHANPCVSYASRSYPVWWWSIWNGLRAIPSIEFLFGRDAWIREGANNATHLQLNAINKYISDLSTSLTFFHFYFPHIPGHRDSTPPATGSDVLPGYEQNLLLVDQTLGNIVTQLEGHANSQDILLIVSSDHWLRTKLMSEDMSPDLFKWEYGNGKTEVQRIPLLIRRIQEKSEYIIKEPLSTIHTTLLIEDFLGGRIREHANIARWWLNKPYVEPFVPERYKVN